MICTRQEKLLQASSKLQPLVISDSNCHVTTNAILVWTAIPTMLQVQLSQPTLKLPKDTGIQSGDTISLKMTLILAMPLSQIGLR